MSQSPDDMQAWHKHFAASCNNRAWELAIARRTPQQDREMLNAAHASGWHWSQIGTELHHMRSTMLLAEVHALLGYQASAMAFATQMRDYFLARETPDWELALTHAIYAHAACVAGAMKRILAIGGGGCLMEQAPSPLKRRRAVPATARS